MQIYSKTVTVRDISDGYADNGPGGVVGYGGRLDIRPPYQREFVYKDAQRSAVIESVNAGYPLNVMYWADRGPGESPRYEVIDGQQRTISLCQYRHNEFALGGTYFHSLRQTEQDAFLDYELTVYVCTGSDTDRLKWFETINIAGEVLTSQELRNANYAGPWLADAKTWFSRAGSMGPQRSSHCLRSKGGRTVESNCRVVHRNINLRKGAS